MRINKFLTRCGVSSRRQADVLIQKGKVTVNGKVLESPGHIVDAAKDVVCVDGKRVTPIDDFTHIVLNKPSGYLTSRNDPHHKTTVIDLLKDIPQRINPVGRLDLDTEGVLLLTNDGELAFRLTHPRYSIKRVYRARVKGKMVSETLSLFQKGIKLPDGAVGKANVSIISTSVNQSEIELELTEGRKREVKHLCEAAGHPVIKLKRISFGGITCRGLKKGRWRELTDAEIDNLKSITGLTG
ncbi:MAG: pseudouridine synthase [candidate division Zixibacteria bacterium]